MSDVYVLVIDLAKRSFQVCATDRGGAVLFNRSLSRAKLLQMLSSKAPCIVAMLGQKLLQLGVLVFKLLKPLGLGHIHAAELGLPFVERRFGYTVLARQIRRLRTGLVLLQDRDNLLFRESCSLHQSVLIRAGL